MASNATSYDVIGHITDILAAEEDWVSLRNISLTSYSVLHLCRRHIFRIIPFDNFYSKRKTPPKQTFITLLANNPTIAQYIRELNYEVHRDDARISPLLSHLLQTIPHLQCLRIRGSRDSSQLDWIEMDPSIRSALLHLMHLPTLTHLDIRATHNLPLSLFTHCLNLKYLDILATHVLPFEDLDCDLSPEIRLLQTPKILHFSSDSSTTAIGMLLSARWRDGRPVVDFAHLKTLFLNFSMFQDADITRRLFKSVEQLEKLSVTVPFFARSLSGLAEMLLSAQNLRTLEFLGPLNLTDIPKLGLCEELEAMAENNMLQVLGLALTVDGCESKASLSAAFGKLEKVLINTGWSALKRVSIEIRPGCCSDKVDRINLSKLLPELYLSHLWSRGILVYQVRI